MPIPEKNVDKRSGLPDTVNMEAGIRQLCAFIPYFASVDPDLACQWKGGERREDGIVIMPYPVYSEAFMQFVSAFYKSNLEERDYLDKLDQMVPDWKTADMSRVIENADFELVRVVLTKAIRVERFCDGAWHDSIRSGLFLNILRRLEVLTQ